MIKMSDKRLAGTSASGDLSHKDKFRVGGYEKPTNHPKKADWDEVFKTK